MTDYFDLEAVSHAHAQAAGGLAAISIANAAENADAKLHRITKLIELADTNALIAGLISAGEILANAAAGAINCSVEDLLDAAIDATIKAAHEQE